MIKTSGPYYIPSSTNAESLISSLNDSIPGEIAIPGNWSAQLFFDDMKNFPVLDKILTAKKISEILKSSGYIPSYLDFFEETRKTPREITSFQKWILEIFEKKSIMLYFEQIFLKFFNSTTELSQEDKILLQYIEALSNVEISVWNTIVSNIGACCYQFFVKEPYLYMNLMKRNTIAVIDYEHMTDQEILQKEKIKLELSECPGRLCIYDSRTKLLNHVKAKIIETKISL